MKFFVLFGDWVDEFNPDSSSSASVILLKIDLSSESSSWIVGCVLPPNSGERRMSRQSKPRALTHAG